ncbi:MAG: hypothetical protein ACE5MG_07090, partial [Candidatus Methylomirabilales bacterium]
MRRPIRRLILPGLVWLLVAGNSGAEPPAPLYDGPPPAHRDVDTFYRYMALLGQHRFSEAFQYRVGVTRETFLQQARAEWQDYSNLFERAGFTFLGWKVRALDYSEDVGGNVYIRMIQIFRLQKENRLVLRHVGFLFRVTFSNQKIYTLDP